MLPIEVSRIDPGLPLPAYARDDDAGLDLYSADDVSIEPGQRRLVATGIAIAIPSGYAGFVHPRSGLALRQGLSIVNTPGTIDAGYSGEIKVLLINHDSTESIQVERGDRIAQLVVQRVEQVELVEVAELSPTQRGASGYGSTGVATQLAADAADSQSADSQSVEQTTNLGLTDNQGQLL